MSAHPWRDLAQPLIDLREVFTALQHQHHCFVDGSAAHQESADRTLAGDWGSHPVRGANAGVLMPVFAVMNHLRALATLLEGPPVVYAPFTVARSALEIAAGAWYLLEPGIGVRERVRRAMNTELRSQKEQALLSSEPGAQAIRDSADRRIAAIVAAARTHQFPVHKGDKIRAPYLGAKPPASTDLAPLVIPGGTGLGALFWKTGSAVAHGHRHGLAMAFTHTGSLLDHAWGEAFGSLELTARDAALRCAGAPLSAVAMLDRLYAHYGWDATRHRAVVQQTLRAWHRVAGLHYTPPSPATPATFHPTPPGT